jgi:FtsZ-binding cell division protein ZapB
VNPLVQRQVERVEGAVSSVEVAIRLYQARVDRLVVERDLLLQEKWRQDKELVTLRRISQEYDDLMDENALFKARHDAVRERLRAVLVQVRALASELRS